MNINDVAEAAGVSRGSVSNYLNNKKVSDKIKLKIEAAIKELNYRPNSSARDLRSKESKFVVFIIPTVWSPFFSELTYYIQNELNSSGYKMILCISDSDFNKEKEYIELATSQKAAGCRLCPCQQRFSRPTEFLCHPGSLLHRLHPIQRRMGVCRPLC